MGHIGIDREDTSMGHIDIDCEDTSMGDIYIYILTGRIRLWEIYIY